MFVGESDGLQEPVFAKNEGTYIWHELHGSSAEEIVDAYSHLTLAGVYAALAYRFYLDEQR